jgi:hypothetical protein
VKRAKPTSKPSRRAPKGRPAKRPASRAARTEQRAASKPKPASKSKPKAKAASKSKPKPKPKPRRAAKRAPAGRAAQGEAKWQKLVEQHGVVLASARGPVPCVAEAVAGEPIVGSWWSHPKAHAIFDALSAIDDADDIRSFKLVDHKVTFVHRRLWPALACLARAGVLDAERVASLQQEHMPTGEHRNFTTPFPDWVPDDVGRSAESLSIDEARAQLGPWV